MRVDPRLSLKALITGIPPVAFKEAISLCATFARMLVEFQHEELRVLHHRKDELLKRMRDGSFHLRIRQLIGQMF